MTKAPVRTDDGEPGGEQSEPPAARVVHTLVVTARTVWDRLGLLVCASLTWAAVMSLPLTIDRWLPRTAPAPAHLLVLLLAPVLGAAPTAGIHALAHRIAANEEAAYPHLWSEGAALFWPAVRLALLQTLALVVLAVAMFFYARLPGLAGRVGAGISGYALLVWAMMLLYQWPALIAQERGLLDDANRRAKRGALAAMRRSFYLALGRPFFTLGILAALLAASALMAMTVALPAVLWMGATALLCTYAARALLMEFKVLPAPVVPEVLPDDKFRISDAPTGSAPGPHTSGERR